MAKSAEYEFPCLDITLTGFNLALHGAALETSSSRLDEGTPTWTPKLRAMRRAEVSQNCQERHLSFALGLQK